MILAWFIAASPLLLLIAAWSIRRWWIHRHPWLCLICAQDADHGAPVMVRECPACRYVKCRHLYSPSPRPRECDACLVRKEIAR